MGSDRVGLSLVCMEYQRTVGRQCEVGTTRLRVWMIDGLLNDLEPECSDKGRWTVLRDKIPLLETIVPDLIERSERRMKHGRIRDPGTAEMAKAGGP
jgi:hypothetical protein